ncbi:MAG: hypothetical protein ACTTKX_06535 [Treponema sp.]
MKRHITIAAVFAVFVFTGCYDAVFQSIRNEIPLEEGTVKGFINSIVRFKSGSDEYLFLQNGRISYKLAKSSAHGEWNEAANQPAGVSFNFYSSSFSGTHFFGLAADTQYVYALGYEPGLNDIGGRNVPKAVKLYCCQTVNKEWKEVIGVNQKIAEYITHLNSSYYMTDASIHLFCTNSPNPTHRKAYIRIGGGGASSAKCNTEYGTDGNGGIIQLDGTNDGTPIAKGTDGAGLSTLSALFYNGKVNFLDYLAAGTNETASSPTTYVYYASSETLYSFPVSSPGTKTSASLSTSKDIISMAVTSDSILLGTNGNGIFRVTRNAAGKPASSTSSFSTNAQNVMYSPYIVRTLFCVSPDLNETATTLYASLQFRYTAQSASADYGNVGLWSYYPNRGNWNKE